MTRSPLVAVVAATAALLVVCAAASVATAAAWPPIWPMPQSFTSGTGTVFVDPSRLKIVTSSGAPPSQDLVRGFARFMQRTFIHIANSSAVPAGVVAVTIVTVNVQNPSAALQSGVDETYKLQIDSTRVRIDASTVFGAYHGLETLSQLTGFHFSSQTYQVRYAPWSVVDGPRFPHRGALVDTARHFQPITSLYRIIDSLTYAKLNLLHWHLVDAQAFPFDAPSNPQLGAKGAYSDSERYTALDVAGVVEYARQRGVRVMVEIDTPGHSGSWCRGMPEVCPGPNLCPSKNINNWALDITKNRTYDAVQGVLKDVANLAFERFMHLGGDEVDTYCWSIHPDIMAWLNERGLSLDGGFEYYLKRIQAYVWANLDRNVVGWQEIWNHFGTSLNKKTIIHQWLPNSVSLPLNVTSHGYRLIWSDSSVWYLDHLSVTWDTMYKAEPCNGLPAANCALVLGGEGCMWGETVDESDVLQTMWPRLGAIAERLWSPRALAQDTSAALPRLIAFRCLLNQRGIASAPVNNPLARSGPPQPGSCFWQ